MMWSMEGMHNHLAKDVGDFVIHRAERFFAYHLAVVVDDALMGITDVIRGSDLLSSTPRQLELFGQFELSSPSFWHVPLLMDDHGQRMSKTGWISVCRGIT